MALKHPFRLLGFAPALLILTACAPGYLLMDEAEYERLDERLGTVDERIDALTKAVEQSDQAAQEAHLARIAGAMEQQTANRWLVPLRPQTFEDDCPEPECPDDRLRSGQELSAEGMFVFGEVESLQLDPPGLVFDARIDTGATTSSVDAREIQEFERDGDPWVRFEMEDPESDQRLAIERPQVREASIRQASGSDARPVVELHVTIGEFSEVAEFTLTDREHLTYPVLIGRNILRDVALVDVGLKRATEPVAPADEDLEAIDADDHIEEIAPDDDDEDDEDEQDDEGEDLDDDNDNAGEEGNGDDEDNGEG